MPGASAQLGAGLAACAANQRSSRPASLLATAAAGMLVVCVNAAPLALGSNRLLPWAVNALAAGSALALATAHAHFAGRDLTARLAPAALCLAPMLAVIGWIAAQALLPVPEALANPLWAEAAGLSQLDLPGRISVNPRESLLGLMRLGTAAAVAVTALLLASDPARARRLVDLFLAAAAVYALYGLFRLAVTPAKVLWFDAKPGAYLAGPFLGRNQAATYFGLAATAALGLLIQDFRRLARPLAASSLRYQLAALMGLMPGALGGRLAVLLLLVSALLLTGSRAGIAVTAAAVAALAALAVWSSLRRARLRSGALRPRASLLFAGALAALLAMILAIAGGRIAERLMEDGLEPGARIAVDLTTLRAIGDHALTGSGYGTFQDIFPLYRADAGPAYFTWDKAHNDYLELTLGLGLPAATLFLAALAAAAARVARGAVRRRRDNALAAVAAAATLLVALHSLVDFSLQIQAITLAYGMLLGVGLAQAEGGGGRR
jgi:O-antigen ligase